MAGHIPAGGGGGKDSVIHNYIKHNIYLKYFIFLFLFLLLIFAGIFLLSGTEQGYYLSKTFNQINFLISGILSFIPGYNLWTENFEAYKYYFQYKYTLNESFFQSPKEYEYLKLIYLELLPFILANFLFLKKFFDIRSLFKDYYSTLKFRNLRVIENPVKKLEEGLLTEGVDNSDYNKEQLAVLKEFYLNKKPTENKELGIIEIYKSKLYNNIQLYYDSLIKLQTKFKNEKEWNNFFEKIIDSEKQPYDFLHLFRYKHIDYSLMEKKDIERLKLAFSWNFHFKYLNLEKKWVSREFYIDSLKKEISYEELYDYYYTTFLFWINKQWTNFPMYIYTHNLKVPLEWKKLNKWVEGLNAPGKTEIIIGKKGNKLILKRVDLYYRLYMFRVYLGIKCEYMTDYIKMIDDKYGVT